MHGFQDPTSGFLISKLVDGAYILKPTVDIRLPITVPILDRLVAALSHIILSVYEMTLFRAMFFLTFNAYARIGQITTTNTFSLSTVLQYANVTIQWKCGQPSKVSVTFRHFKHNLSSSPHVISFGHGPIAVSAFQSVADYIKVRGASSGPFFCHVQGFSVSRLPFDRLFLRALKYCNLDSAKYKGHSFRIGAATHAAKRTFSDSRVRALGRWSSNAFRKYIRLTGGFLSLSLTFALPRVVCPCVRMLQSLCCQLATLYLEYAIYY